MSGVTRGPSLLGIGAPAHGFGCRHPAAANDLSLLGGSNVSGVTRGPSLLEIGAPAHGFGCRHLKASSHRQPSGGSVESRTNQKRKT